MRQLPDQQNRTYRPPVPLLDCAIANDIPYKKPLNGPNIPTFRYAKRTGTEHAAGESTLAILGDATAQNRTRMPMK